MLLGAAAAGFGSAGAGPGEFGLLSPLAALAVDPVVAGALRRFGVDLDGPPPQARTPPPPPHTLPPHGHPNQLTNQPTNQSF